MRLALVRLAISALVVEFCLNGVGPCEPLRKIAIQVLNDPCGLVDVRELNNGRPLAGTRGKHSQALDRAVGAEHAAEGSLVQIRWEVPDVQGIARRLTTIGRCIVGIALAAHGVVALSGLLVPSGTGAPILCGPRRFSTFVVAAPLRPAVTALLAGPLRRARGLRAPGPALVPLCGALLPTVWTAPALRLALVGGLLCFTVAGGREPHL
mmetsp:Transcript_27894/g.77124  ORF Transcript_27894/g.77124 Transcript_27894/m.77124 type:complete len:209 (+) Transcript_27894:328-954(+)